MSSKPANVVNTKPLPEVLLTSDRLAALAQLQHTVAESPDLASLWTRIAEPAGQLLGTSSVAVWGVHRGGWQVLSAAGAPQPAPVDLLGEALDRAATVGSGHWLAAPLDPRGEEVLAAAWADTSGETRALFDALCHLLRPAVQERRADEARLRRIARLEAVLDIAMRLNHEREMEPLLKQIAESAKRLLGADRASIFLWDRATHTLVGRPALGVDNGELRIPDTAGVVGSVVQTGEPKRIERGRDEREIDRQVDTDLGYRTHSLLCVPLVGRGGSRIGAFEVINKLEGDFSSEDEETLTALAVHASIALENTQERTALVRTQKQLAEQTTAGVELIGVSPPIEALRSSLSRVAGTELAILILGENGTGKEVVARLTHALSRRRLQPFIAVNCAAIAETLLESELFGHERGAFTDAHEARQGKFELAAGGTLFLDEIGDLSPAGQAKLLRVLEEKIVVRVGGSTPIHTDVRVLAATNQPLAELVRQKKFREDLFFRLNVVSLEMPPLRERGDDVLLLSEHFLATFSQKAGRKTPKLAAAARKRLLAHEWPGNVRELRNLMERLAYLAHGETIEPEDLAFILFATTPPSLVDPDLSLSEATDHFQSDYIEQAIRRSHGNMSAAAERLGLHRSNLYRKMRQLEMPGGN
jgi:Nif-specific regulatory protein